MDDPWGSPWAAAENRETSLPPVASADATDAAGGPQLPPPARTSIPSLSLPSLAEPSPWADDATPGLGVDAGGGFGGFGGFRGAVDDFDDSAFGDWATANPTATPTATPGGLGLGLDSGLSPFSSNKTSNNNFNNNTSFFPGDASPITWPSPTASRSPSRAPNRSPATSISARRAPSIEPGRNEPKEPEWERPQTPSPDPKRRPSPSSKVDDSHTDHVKEDDHDDRDHAAGADTDGDDGDDVVEGDSPITSVDDNAPAAALPKIRDGKSAARSQSLEPRQPLRRKASNKVQELVEHFDGLAKTLSVTSSASASRRPSPSPSRITKDEVEGETKDGNDDDGKAEDHYNDSDDDDNSDDGKAEDQSDDSDDDEDDDFADFEGPEPAVDEARPQTPEQRPEDGEVDAAAEKETTRTPPVASPAASVPSAPTQAPSPVRRGRPGAATAASAAIEPPLLSIAALLDHYGSISPYTPPADKLDALFAAEEALLGLPAQNEQPQPQPQPNDADAYVPDHVLTDSFTAVSERRVWYRIARAGSSRRYNQAGGLDDDNYRPITWATSTAVRPDTLRIVRRWVEEDAFTGRATLGGGRRGGRRVSSGTAGDGHSHGIGIGIGHGHHESVDTGSISRRLFGWDSTAAPLTLDAVYRKKRPSNHHKARPMSMGSNTVTAAAVPATRHSVHLTGAQRAGLGLASTLSSGPTFSSDLSILTSGLGNTATSSLASATTPESSASEWTQPALHGGSSKSLAIASPVVVSPVVAPPAADNAGDDGDDDDWGEMVSSPAVGAGFSGAGFAAAALAALTGLPATTAAKTVGIPPPRAVMPPPVVAHTQPPLATADIDGAVDVILRGLPDLSYMAK